MSIQVLVVAQPEDELATALVSLCEKRGVSTQRLDHEQAAQAVTIWTGPEGPRIEPDLPTYLGPMSPGQLAQESDAIFLRGEQLAALWAATALTSSPVLGRPGDFGFGGRVSRSAVVTELNGGYHAGRPERFQSWVAGEAPAPPMERSTSDWWWECEQSRRIDEACNLAPNAGPFRGRPVPCDEAYELVTVVSRRAFRSSMAALPVDRIEDRSVEHSRALGCSFATVIWGFGDGESRVARVDPWPTWAQVRHAWADIGDAMVRFLLT